MIERFSIGPERGDLLRVRWRRDGVSLRVALEGACAREIDVRVLGEPDIRCWQPEAVWTMASGLPLGASRRDVLTLVRDHVASHLRTLRQLPFEVCEPFIEQLRSALGAVGRRLAGMCRPRSREVALRFPLHARFWLYGRLIGDGTGRLRQLSEVAPGALLLAHALFERGLGAVADRLFEDVVRGRRLNPSLDGALEAWEADGLGRDEEDGAWAFYRAYAPLWPGRLRERQRLLVRRASSLVPSTLVWLPPPVALVPEDIPVGARANAAWFRRMKRKAFYPPDPAHFDASVALALFVSRHGPAIDAALGSPRRWMKQLWHLVRDEDLRPARASSPLHLISRLRLLGPRGRPSEEEVRVIPPVGAWGGADGVRIEPLTSSHQLEMEGHGMRHCVASYWTRVLAGTSAIFAMSGPGTVRLTLELEFAGGARSWRLRGVRGPDNASPTPVQWSYVRRWLRWVGRRLNLQEETTALPRPEDP
jgi:hypothetical protein